MGIEVEFNPDLALRDYREFEQGLRKEDECIPKILETGKVYSFLKKGLRIFWLTDDEEWSKGEIPLMITKGNQKLSRPIASIKMLEVTHFLLNKATYTKGKYRVIEVFDPNDDKVKFESYKRIK
jgi:hypothetical protein